MINSDGSILISQSAYNGTMFWTQTLKSPYTYGSEYTLQGFIYPLIDFESEGDEEPMKTLKVGDLVKIQKGAIWSTGKPVPDWALKDVWKVADVSHPLIKVDENESKTNSIKSWLDVKYLDLVEKAVVSPTSDFYTNIRIDEDLKEGYSGASVKLLQIRIAQISPEFDKEIRENCFNDEGHPDGNWGSGLTATVKKVQQMAKIPVTGQLDKATRDVLNANALVLNAKIIDAKAVLEK
jgi:hypothetical protein